MLVLGINAYHADSAACIVINGEVKAAAEEERFRREKHWAGFPSEAARYCIREAGIRLSDVDIVAINSAPRAHLAKKVSYVFTKRPSISLIADRLRNMSRRTNIRDEIIALDPIAKFDGKVIQVEHHLAHMASAFLVCPFGSASIASVDGFGDFCSTAWGHGSGNNIHIDGRVYFPHSLGIFYQALTQYLGFPNYGDEYKVMGLAPYGDDEYASKLEKLITLGNQGQFVLNLEYFRHHSNAFGYQWDSGIPHVDRLFTPLLEELFGPARQLHDSLEKRHLNLARSVQSMYEKVFFHVIDHLYGLHKSEALTLAGGCAMNSVANGQIARRGPFKQVYVQAAAGDAGGAIGAAVYAWHTSSRGLQLPQIDFPSHALRGNVPVPRYVMDHAYLGPSASADEVRQLLDERSQQLELESCHISFLDDEDGLCAAAAAHVANGDVVGWFQGRMEWGPRALGNRSIVCDPRRGNMKEVLNTKIKRRESFRPFAPSIQQEHVAEWFEENGDVPFMMQVYQVNAGKRPLIPAVTHVDGSGRLQTVYRKTNRRYWKLIEEFRQITGIPIVLNTSFNENEPIVCQPSEALDCFMRTNMDVLVLDKWLVRRKAARPPIPSV